jgi:NAD(P)H-dependent FMN reductase
MKTLNTVIISGSVRKGRQTHKVSVELHKRLIGVGFTNSNLLDIAAYNFPIAEERVGKLESPPSAIEEVQQILNDAEAMIFVSPEYHGSYSGALKNFLDYFSKEFYRKPIAVASVSTGRFGGINASTEMQQLVLSLGAFAMPQKLIVPAIHNSIDETGDVKDEFLDANFNKFIAEFTWFAEAITEKKSRKD